MAAPTVETTTTSIQDGNVTTHTVSYPSGMSAGETVVTVVAIDTATDPAPTWPSGGNNDQTQIFGVIDSTGPSVALYVVWHKVNGSEGGSTWTFTTSETQESSHCAFRISGAEDPDTTPPEASTGADGSSTTADPDSLTPAGGADDYLYLACAAFDGGRDITVFPSGYSNNLEADSGGGAQGCTAGAASLATTGSTSENPGTFTLEETREWVAATVAVYPAGGLTFPSAPTNLTATAVSTSQINLSWDAVSGAGGYDIERDSVVIVSDHQSTSYSDTGLNTGQSYDYRVRAVS